MQISTNKQLTNFSGVAQPSQPLSAELRARENQVKKTEKVENAAAAQRLDIDQQALAAVEQDEQKRSAQQQSEQQRFVLVENNQVNAKFNSGDARSNNSSEQNKNYDRPSKQNQTAVSAYQAIDNLVNREQVKQLFGVDLVV